MTPRVGEDEVTIAALSVAELYPESSSLIDGALGEVGWGDIGVGHGAKRRRKQ
jgi:hypothetical protein